MQSVPWERVRDLLDAILELPSGERRSYLDGHCTEPVLRRHVESLILAYEQAGSFLEGATTAESPSLDQGRPAAGSRLGAYLLLNELGEGGMGTVYRAMRADDEYRKLVAIKIVRSGLAAYLLDRFRTERQILATLDHPNIAKLLDGGTTPEGLPYVVMEFVEGRPIDEYCDAHGLPIPIRLRLFLGVCAAVQYAHQNLVIHRDLKPGNILVTGDGVPKLLDFGIAKILNPEWLPGEQDRTRTAMMLTPEYASPEQLRGEAITTASDVYSLGVVLYLLLTRRGPYQFQNRFPHEVARVIAETDPVKPSAAVAGRASAEASAATGDAGKARASAGLPASPEHLRRSLRGDLDTIVLKALAKDPERRYRTVEQLAEDLRRHLDGRPVLARRPTLAYRAGKFVARHRAGTAAAALVLALVIAGVGAVLREARIAREERARAEQRFRDVRSLANSLMFDIHDAIQELPGSTAARQLLVQKALQYLDSLARETSGDASLQRELAAAYERVGDVQGYPYRPNLGDTAGAVASYRKALQIRQALASGGKQEVGDACALATSHRLLAETLLVSGDSAGAMQHTREALKITEPLARVERGNAKVLAELEEDNETAGDIAAGNVHSANLGDLDSARESYLKGMAASEELIRLDPGSVRAKRLMPVFNVKLGDVLMLAGETSTALDYYQRAIERFQALLPADHPSAPAQRDVGNVYGRIGFVLEMKGDFAKALDNYRKDLEIDEKLAAADPNNAQARLDLALSYSNVGELMARTGKLPAGLTMMQKAVSIGEALVAQTPGNSEFRSSLGIFAMTIGERLSDYGKYAEALEWHRKALAAFQKLAVEDPNNDDARLNAAATEVKMAAALARSGNPTQAREAYQKALTAAGPAAEAASPNQQALYIVAEAYAGLGDLILSGKVGAKQAPQWAEARVWYQRSLDAWRKIPHPARVTPNGFDAADPSAVTKRLAESNAKIARSKAGKVS